MKKLYVILGLVLITLTAWSQKAEQTFKVIVEFEKGFVLGGKTYTFIPEGISTVTWDLITGKPVNFLPAPHTHLWSDVIPNPADKFLKEAIELMEYLPLPGKTAAEISKIVVPVGRAGMVFNVTDTAVMIYYGGSWKFFILNK